MNLNSDLGLVFGPNPLEFDKGRTWTTNIPTGYIPTSSKPREEIVQRIGKVKDLTIHYKNGAEYNVSNAMDVAVIKRAGGSFDISYVVSVDYEDNLGGIVEIGKGTLAYETHSGDVVAITARMSKVGDSRETKYIEFGGE